MTDPTGDVFLSYRHSQKHIAVELDQRLREHGIPVWRDERKIGPNPLESQIEAVLESGDISGALLLVSEDIVDSSTIVNVELPGVHSLHDANDDFFVFVLCCSGISASQAKEILGTINTLNDFSEWYFHSLNQGDSDSPNYDGIVENVLEKRLNSILQHSGDTGTGVCSIHSHESREQTTESWFHADLSHHFDTRLPNQEVWNARIQPTITRLMDQLARKAEDRRIDFTGQAHLPIAFAIGTQFPTTRGIHATWTQQDPNFDVTTWDGTLSLEDSGTTVDSQLKDSENTDLAVLLSLADEVRTEVGNTTGNLPDFHTLVEITRGEFGTIMTPDQVVYIATTFRETVRDELNARPNLDTIHVFQSAPVGLAFLLGQQTNTLPRIQTYALADTQRPRKYEPAISIE
jgi:hypothetical protein